MSIKKVSPDALNRWVDVLIGKQRVYGIQEIGMGDRYGFEPLNRADDLRLGYDLALTAPKKFFQPPCETLLTFDEEGNYKAVEDAEPFVIFGVHPYDVVAIAQMDEVHSKDNEDIHYTKKRENATIVAVDIQNPSKNVFAAAMGTATVDDGFDILLTLVGDQYVVDSRTDKGEALMADLTEGDEPDDITLARREQVWEDAQRFLKKHNLNCKPEDLPELLEQSYDHPIWEQRAEKCYSCGSCVLVCPTCYCFDVQDDSDWNLKSGSRQRKWDGCMLQEFANVAGDHNFRKHRSERYRHRFYRKGKYLWDRYGQIACIGCGRCITACTTNIANPVEVYNKLLEDK